MPGVARGWAGSVDGLSWVTPMVCPQHASWLCWLVPFSFPKLQPPLPNLPLSHQLVAPSQSRLCLWRCPKCSRVLLGPVPCSCTHLSLVSFFSSQREQGSQPYSLRLYNGHSDSLAHHSEPVPAEMVAVIALCIGPTFPPRAPTPLSHLPGKTISK